MSQKSDRFITFFCNYGEFHHNSINKWIHIIFVPIISFTLFFVTEKFALYSFKEDSLFELLNLNFGLILCTVTTLLWLRTETYCGAVTSAWFWLLFFLSKSLYFHSEIQGSYDCWFKSLLILHIVAWLTQFVGHGVFEKRAPALCSNLLLTMNAPFFVTAEILQMFGWKEEEFKIIEEEVSKRIENFRKVKKNWINYCDKKD